MPMEDEFITLKKEKVTIKEIIALHIKKISDLSCKELRSSYWSKKPMKIGDGVAMAETYHEDSRLAYINAINFLQDLLMPRADKTFKEVIKKLNEDEENKYKKNKEDKKTQNDWIWIQLELRRKLFGELILLIARIKMFDPTPIMTQEDMEEMIELEEEREREEQEEKEKNQ